MTTFKVLVHDLTPKQQKFVANILKAVSEGNESYTQTQAARDVTDSTKEVAAVTASRWMQQEKIIHAIYKGVLKAGQAAVEESKWPGVKKVSEEWIIHCLGLLSVHPKVAANNKIACLKLIGSWRKFSMWREVQIVADVDTAKEEQDILREIDSVEAEINRPTKGNAPAGEAPNAEGAGLQGEESARLRGEDSDAGSVPERPGSPENSLDG